MFNRNSRWLVLTLFAVVNLVCWAGVAAAVGLAASPSLDLGLEALIREGQATAAAMWEREDRQSSYPAVTPEEAEPGPLPAGTETTGDEPMAAVVTPGNPGPASTPRRRW